MMSRGESVLSTLERNWDSLPWGDYGSILSNGMGHRNDHGVVEVERVGPFTPPMTFPGQGNVVITDAVKRIIERSGLPGIGAFVPVGKKKIVRIPWREWDLKAKSPKMYPAGGEPENYILEAAHCETTSNEVGNLWSWEPERIGTVERLNGNVRLCGVVETNLAVFRMNDTHFRRVIVRSSAVEVLREVVGDWVTFAGLKYPCS